MLIPVFQRGPAAAGINPGTSQEGVSSFGKETTIGWAVLGVQRLGALSSGCAAAGLRVSLPSFCSLGNTGNSGWQTWLFLHTSRAAACKTAAFLVDPTFCSHWQESAVASAGSAVGARSGG